MMASLVGECHAQIKLNANWNCHEVNTIRGHTYVVRAHQRG